jgi:hypothetical protein
MDTKESASLQKDPIIKSAFEQHKATIIIIHNREHSLKKLDEIIENWKDIDNISHVKFILLHAPETSNPPDMNTIKSSTEHAQILIENEISAGILADFIIAVGFGQGGVIALSAGLAFPELAGVGCCSLQLSPISEFRGYIPKESANKKTPVFLSHFRGSHRYMLGLATVLTNTGLKQLFWDCYR